VVVTIWIEYEMYISGAGNALDPDTEFGCLCHKIIPAKIRRKTAARRKSAENLAR